MDEKKYENKCLEQLIISNDIESIKGLKAVCPICVKSHRLSRKNASRGRYTHARKQLEKGLFSVITSINHNFSSSSLSLFLHFSKIPLTLFHMKRETIFGVFWLDRPFSTATTLIYTFILHRRSPHSKPFFYTVNRSRVPMTRNTDFHSTLQLLFLLC